MKEQIIELETARLARVAGFKKRVKGRYFCKDAWKDWKFYESGITDSKNNEDDVISAPTQSLLQKWLRKKHKIHITVTSISQESWQCHVTKIGEPLGKTYTEDHYDYEDALESGLQLALSIVIHN